MKVKRVAIAAGILGYVTSTLVACAPTSPNQAAESNRGGSTQLKSVAVTGWRLE